MREKKERERREQEKTRAEELAYLEFLGAMGERRELNYRSKRLGVQQRVSEREEAFKVGRD